MSNHYHLLVETPEGNLAQGMRHYNGVYTQRFNRRHQRVGHVFQGRYKAIIVQKESYLLELARYIVLNPVRAGMVRNAKDWPWSSYRSTAGFSAPLPWLQTDWILSAFSRRKGEAKTFVRKPDTKVELLRSSWDELKKGDRVAVVFEKGEPRPAERVRVILRGGLKPLPPGLATRLYDPAYDKSVSDVDGIGEWPPGVPWPPANANAAPGTAPAPAQAR